MGCTGAEWRTYRAKREELIAQLHAYGAKAGVSAEEHVDEVLTQDHEARKDVLYDKVRDSIRAAAYSNRRNQILLQRTPKRAVTTARLMLRDDRYLKGMSSHVRKIICWIASGKPYKATASALGTTHHSIGSHWHQVLQYWRAYRAVTRRPDERYMAMRDTLKETQRRILDLAASGCDNVFIAEELKIPAPRVNKYLHALCHRHPELRYYLPRPKTYMRLYNQENQ